MKAETMYECEKENQEYLDSLNLKSSCCNDDLIATTMDNWLCVACGQEHKPKEMIKNATKNKKIESPIFKGLSEIKKRLRRERK
jgi:hypothetical protein